MTMAKHIYEIEDSSKQNTNKTSFYDQVYDVIDKEIENYMGPAPKMVHWLSEESKNEARKESKINPIPSISSIKDPTKLVKIIYQDVDFEYFNKKYGSAN